ncbi:amidase family protein [Rhodococcus kronopolitis]|uniref:Amidase family protein n=1 Tax=Rhodococcus kronopolitis TaxID=1460226 RepID=A0ABV9FXL3_9NOCA
MTDLSRRAFLSIGAATGAAALLGGCGDDAADPGVPPLPGGGPAATATPASRATWRVQGSPLVTATGSGALDGKSVAVTDLFAVAGQQVGAGNPRWLAQAPVESRTAPAVAALLAAGATVTGLAQTDDLGYGHSGANDLTGTPPNVAAPERLPGGSTSGAGSAAADGAVSLGLGPDTDGSVRIPAAYQGLYGCSATRGAVSTDGMVGLSTTLDTVGWLGADLDVLAEAVAASVPATPARPLTAAVTSRGLVAVADAPVQAATNAALAAWRTADLPRLADENFDIGALPDWYEAVATVVAYEAWQRHGAFVAAASTSLSAEPRENFGQAGRTSEASYRRASDTLAGAAAAVHAFLGDRVLVLPTTASPAPPRSDGDLSGETYRNTMRSTGMLTAVATVAGLPTVTVPLRTAEKNPVGLCLVGPAGRDLDLLALASAVAEQLPLALR